MGKARAASGAAAGASDRSGGTLWTSGDVPATWAAALASYPSMILRRSAESARKRELVALDQWLSVELPISITLNGQLTAAELGEIAKWKVSRGSFRPGLWQRVAANSDAAAAAATRAAFAALPAVHGPGGALEALTALHGVGPATASAVLAAAAPGRAPFMSNEAMDACLPPARNSGDAYSAARYEALADALRAKAAALGSGWTAADVERALWADAMAARSGGAVTPSKALSKAQRVAAGALADSDGGNTRKRGGAAVVSVPKPKRHR